MELSGDAVTSHGERCDRESELLVHACLHAVSTMLNTSSFLRIHAVAAAAYRRHVRSPEQTVMRLIAREWFVPAQQQGSPGITSRQPSWLLGRRSHHKL